MTLLVGRKIIKAQSTALNIVFYLLGDIRLVRHTVEFVTSTTELIDAMILHGQPRIRTQFEV